MALSPAQRGIVPRMISNTLSVRLREATRNAHHRLDHHPALAPLVRNGVSRGHYVDVLAAMAWIYRTLDVALLDALARLCPDDGYRCSERSPWLSADLAYFGRYESPVLPCHPPTIPTAAALVGRIYTIEGSTLGGQVIAQRVAASLGVGPETGGRMFHGHGPSTRARWEEFQAFASRTCPVDEYADACDAANLMFSELADLLDRWPWRSLPSPADARQPVGIPRD